MNIVVLEITFLLDDGYDYLANQNPGYKIIMHVKMVWNVIWMVA